MTLGTPRRVRAALQQVFERHPYTADGEVHASSRVDADAARLWDRLCALSGDTDALAGAVRALTRQTERVLLYGAAARLEQPRCLDVLAAVYRLRSPEGERALALGWELWLLTDGVPAFQGPAARYVSRYPARTAWSDLVQLGVAPLSRAAATVERTRTPLEGWAAAPGVAFADRTHVMRALRRKLLHPGRLIATVAREGGTTVVRWMEQVLNDGERADGYVLYLNATWRSEWRVDDALVLAILQRYGEPRLGRDFWGAVEPGAVAAVESWIKLVELTKLLGEGEHGERVSFWRKFLPQIRSFVSNRDKEAVLICFDRWIAVQFVRPGVATYLYPSSFLTGFKRLEGQRLAAKVREMARIDEHLDRYEQRGLVETWQSAAEWTVREVMRRMEGRS